MLTFVARRIAYSIPVVLVASVLVFLFFHATTDPLLRFRTSRDPTVLTTQGLRAGLLEGPCKVVGHTVGGRPIQTCHKTPVFKQYWTWLSHFLQGKMGTSFVTGHLVSADIRSALWNTIQLITFGILLSAVVAIGIGIYSAVRQYSVLDYVFTGLSFAGLSMPPFWFGLIAIEFFAFDLRSWFHLNQPIFYSIGLHSGTNSGLVDFGRHLFLPVLTLTVQIIAEWSRYQRSSMLEVMSSDYIRTARAKGLSQTRVVLKHGLRNALIPLVTVMAIDIGALFGGLLITEQIFSWPGMGKLFVTALLNGDTNVLLPWLMVTALFVIVFNLLADVLYAVLDPRIRLA